MGVEVVNFGGFEVAPAPFEAKPETKPETNGKVEQGKGEPPKKAEESSSSSSKISSDVPKDAAEEWPAAKQIRSFYFVKYRHFDDPKIKAKLEVADKELEKLNKARSVVIEGLRAKKAERSKLFDMLDPLKSERQGFNNKFDEKRKEMEPLQQALGKLRGNDGGSSRGPVICSSQEELNSMIYSYEYRIQHESIPLTEEKQLLKEIRLLEGTRDKVIANEAMRAKIKEAMGHKDDIQGQVKLMGAGLDGVKKERQAISARINELSEKVKATKDEIQVLENELKTVTEKRDKAYSNIRELKKQSAETNSGFYQGRNVLNKARELAAQRNVDELEALSNAEVEKFVSLWCSKKNFREDYEKSLRFTIYDCSYLVTVNSRPKLHSAMKGGRRVTRSTTRLDRNSLTLPVEVVIEIFLRLQLNSLARCRCVCKLWSSVLRSQGFTDSFLTKSCARPQLLFACSDYRREIHFLSSPQPENPEDNSHVVAANHLARFPTSYCFFGCTNGFFCYGANQGKNKPVLVTVICNPSTGQSLTLPRLNSKERYRVESYLGYDPVAKEFKVLSVCDGKEFHVLTLGTKKLSWRVVECCIPHYSSRKWICISGVLYYIAAEPRSSSGESMVVCFDLGTEKFSFVNLLRLKRALPQSTTLVNYNDRLGLLMSSEDTCYVFRSCKRFKLWVLRDAAKHEWSKHVFILPPLWKDVVVDRMCIAGIAGVNEIVLAPWFQYVPSYVIYYNVKSKTIRKVGIQGMEALQGRRLNTYLNYVENVKLL